MKEYIFRGHENIHKTYAEHKDYPDIHTPFDLYDALEKIWCRNTCAPRMQEKWTEENKTFGQCSITAFLCQDIFGGEVYGMKTESGGVHCYNVVHGEVFDLTSEQYQEKMQDLVYDLSVDVLQHREDAHHFGKEEKKERYLYLRSKLLESQGR